MLLALLLDNSTLFHALDLLSLPNILKRQAYQFAFPRYVSAAAVAH